MIFLRMFWEFFKTGLFSVGGGLATLPFLYEMAEKTGWFTAEDVGTMIAVSEATPGAIGVNMSTYVGYMVKGVLGSIVTTVGMVIPSIIIIIIISKILEQFKNSKIVKNAFYGLRPAATGLIAAAGIGVAKVALFNAETIGNMDKVLEWFRFGPIIIAVVVFVLMKKYKKVHPIVFIAASAVVGIVFQL